MSSDDLLGTSRAVEEIALSYAEALSDDFPVAATYLGRHDQDFRLGEYSAEIFESHGRRIASLSRKLAGGPGAATLEGRALQGTLSTSLLEIEREQQWRRNPDVAIESALGGCFALLLREFAPLPDRIAALRSRLVEMPAYLDGARRTWTDVPALWAETAADSASFGAEFLRGDLALALGESTDASQTMSAAENAADALDLAASHLRSLADSTASWRLGEELVAQRLLVQHHLKDSPAEMESRGLTLVEEAIAALDNADPQWRKTLAQLKENHPRAEDLVETYRAEMERARDFVALHNIAPISDAPLEVRPTPRFWAHVLPYAAYDPPGYFEPDQRGIFWVTVPQGPNAAEQLGGHPFAGLIVTVVHEGYPGHHLQLTHANAYGGLARTISDSTLTVEGWAFYCEQMLGEVGYYDTDSASGLYQLKDALWRAARVVLDMRLHAGDLSFDEAVRYLVEVADLEVPNAQAEVRRYTSSPTYQICYAIGKAEILSLRETMQQRLGADFDLGRFHRDLLGYGSVAVPLAAEAMLEQ